MITHACFKALLFLGAGSVIHGMHDEQDMRWMGALRNGMPIASGTFIVGWLAISGVPPFCGFWSKDEILTVRAAEEPALYVVGSSPRAHRLLHVPANVHGRSTAMRSGPSRTKPKKSPANRPRPRRPRHADGGGPVADRRRQAHVPEGFQPHESPWTMTLPLVVLAVLAAIGRSVEPAVPRQLHFLENWLEPSFALSRPGPPRLQRRRHRGAARRLHGRAPHRHRHRLVIYKRRRCPSSNRNRSHDGLVHRQQHRRVGRRARHRASRKAPLGRFRRHRRGGQRRRAESPVDAARVRLAQTGYVRVYALGWRPAPSS